MTEEAMSLRLFLIISLIILAGCNDTSSNSSSSQTHSTLVSNPILLPVKVAGQWGYADSSGKLIVTPQFDWADPFEGGKALICLGKSGCDPYAFYSDTDNDAHWGFIDSSGKIVVSPQYSFATRFSEGLAAVRTTDRTTRPKQKHTYGYIDGDGKVVIPLQFGAAHIFKESLAAVCIGECRLDDAGNWSGKWGFINHSGNFIVNPQYDSVDDFTTSGFAQVMIGLGKDAKIGYIDKTGKIVWPPSN
jgi:WG repeat protein